MTVSSAAPRKKRSRAKGCLLWLLVIVIGLAVVAGAGYFAVQSGMLSLMQIQAMVDGVGEISVVNTSNAQLTVRYIQLETEDGSPDTVETDRIEPFDIDGLGGMVPGPYRLEFTSDGESPPAASCTLILGRGQKFTFVAVPQGIAVTREGFSATDGADLLVESSSLCRQ
jgi:hypothetical protein